MGTGEDIHKNAEAVISWIELYMNCKLSFCNCRWVRWLPSTWANVATKCTCMNTATVRIHYPNKTNKRPSPLNHWVDWRLNIDGSRFDRTVSYILHTVLQTFVMGSWSPDAASIWRCRHVGARHYPKWDSNWTFSTMVYRCGAACCTISEGVQVSSPTMRILIRFGGGRKFGNL